MKKSKFISAAITAFIMLFLVSSINVQGNDETKYSEVQIKTSAQCGMCKTRIEEAVNRLSGIEKANLDVNSKILTVNYDSEKTNPEEIREAVSEAGYDADSYKANQIAYNKLPKCCQKKFDKDSEKKCCKKSEMKCDKDSEKKCCKKSEMKCSEEAKKKCQEKK